jgi:hypothetical protein
MTKKIQREFRDRPLTSQEASNDEKLRSQLAAEFPPASATAPADASSLSEMLRKSMLESDKSTLEMAAAIGVSPKLLERFLAGERDIHMITADKLAKLLQLEVTIE